tara:strand:+ start:76 stop:2457 length:2382 start_codon:yes stop_codon:yes gene_type:complete
MDQKGGFSDFKILFLTLILFTISFFVYSAFISVASLDYSNSAIIAYGGSEGNNNGTKGGEEETINLTIVHTGTGDNITHINITLPPVANYTFLYFISGGSVGEIESGDNLPNETIPVSNVTFYSDGTLAASWGCYNVSAVQLTCNISENVGTDFTDALGGGFNNTLVIMFNVSAGSARTEHTANIEVVTSNETNEQVFLNTTQLNLTIDNRAPRLTDINISDGNTTLMNSSHTGVDLSHYNISRFSTLSNASNLTVTMTIQEHGIDTVLLYYNCSTDSNSNATSYNDDTFFHPNAAKNYSFKGVQGTGASAVEVSTEVMAYTGIIDDTCTGVNGNTVATLLLVANDTYGNTVEINYTGGTPFTFLTKGSGDGLPTFYDVNVTDQTNTLSGHGALDGNSDYLSMGNHTFNAEYSGWGTNTTDVIFVYNLSNNLVIGPNAFDASSYIVKNALLNNVSTISKASSNNTKAGVLISYVNFITGANKSTNVTFAWIANATNRQGNAYETNYTVISGPFSYVIDGGNPAAELVDPVDTSIDVRTTISYTCKGTDTESGVATYVTTITKPSGVKVSESTTVANTAVSFTGDDTNEAGTYSVDCTLTDGVGNQNTVSSSFTALFTTGSSSSGGGSGGGSTATVSFDVDFSEAATTEATMQVAEGSTRTFSFDGATTHTLKVDSVSSTSATITISSDPQTFEMNVGETRGVDINDDGLDDLEVTLNSVDNGVVDLSIVKVEEGAAIVAEEEIAAAAEETTTGTVDEVAPTPTEAKGYGTTITIIVILVIVVLLVVYYFMQKK